MPTKTSKDPDRAKASATRGVVSSAGADAAPSATVAHTRPVGRKKPGADQVPPGFEAVRLLDIKECVAVGRMSTTWWRDLVATGKAPQPVVRSPRCTRWRAADVHRFWAEFAAGPEGAK